jgi:RNA-dependent RNA polymerase
VKPGKVYQEMNILCANSIDFGVKVADTTMMLMGHVAAPRRIQVILNLRRTEVAINFPMKLHGVTYNYRFELPINQLQHIYKVHDTKTGNPTLIIPFNVPPRFFKFVSDKEELASTFNPNDKSWWKWHAWYRQTDVVDNETSQRIQLEPLMNMKDTPIIDIGNSSGSDSYEYSN